MKLNLTIRPGTEVEMGNLKWKFEDRAHDYKWTCTSGVRFLNLYKESNDPDVVEVCFSKHRMKKIPIRAVISAIPVFSRNMPIIEETREEFYLIASHEGLNSDVVFAIDTAWLEWVTREGTLRDLIEILLAHVNGLVIETKRSTLKKD